MLNRDHPEGLEHLTFRILNNGRAVAKHCGCFIELSAGTIIERVEGNLTRVSHLNDGRPCLEFGNDHSVIHPNNIMRHIGAVLLRRPDANTDLRIYIRVYCDGMRSSETIINVEPSRAGAEPAKLDSENRDES
jgi:hypothetical protein